MTPRQLLGKTTAEADQRLLRLSFVETSAFQAVTKTTDFNFVVGRRGTGKSAIFCMAGERFRNDPAWISISLHNAEYENQALLAKLDHLDPKYPLAREFVRLAFRIYAVCSVAEEMNIRSERELEDKSFAEFACTILDNYPGNDLREVPRIIAKEYEIEKLQNAVASALDDQQRRAVILVDGLDEGWEPTATATAIVGGIVRAASAWVWNALGSRSGSKLDLGDVVIAA